MATLTIKNVPRDLYKQLKKRAAEHRRSMNGEVIVCLENWLRSPRTDGGKDPFLEIAREWRKKTAGHVLTDEELEAAINEGRE
jgi:plasmid stability protein